MVPTKNHNSKKKIKMFPIGQFYECLHKWNENTEISKLFQKPRNE
jgi:hypothetical protein